MRQHALQTGLFRVRTTLWKYGGVGGWHFATLSQRHADVIRTVYGDKRSAYGSIRISVTVKKTTWKTSLFPDKKSGSYLFAIKAEVRRAEKISAGDVITATICIE